MMLRAVAAVVAVLSVQALASQDDVKSCLTTFNGLYFDTDKPCDLVKKLDSCLSAASADVPAGDDVLARARATATNARADNKCSKAGPSTPRIASNGNSLRVEVDSESD